MAEATTNLQDVAADRLSIFNQEKRRHEDVRDVFLNVSKITEATSFEQRVGDEVDIILTYPHPRPGDVPDLAGIVAYIEQEKLGAGSVNNKYYNINRTNTAILQEAETVPLRGRRGADGIRGSRGAAGKAQILVQEGDLNVTTRSAPSQRGRQEMVLLQGDVHIARITKNREVHNTSVNHTETQLLNVTKRAKHTRNEQLHFHEGGHTSIRNSIMNRRTHNIVEIYAPVFLQRVKMVTKVNRAIYIFQA
jgi:hypothetical protein